MDFNDYQQEVMRTCGVSKAESREGLVMTAMGVSGEAGEIIEHIKKVTFHAHRFDRTLVEKELGDVMWYVAALAEFCDLKLSDVVEKNVDKLRKRYPDGFTSERSINRSEDDT